MSFDKIAEAVLSDPDYQKANLQTKQVVFARLIAKEPEFANANAATQAAIRQQFGLEEPAPKSDSKPAPKAEEKADITITPEGAGAAGAAVGASSLLAPKVVGTSEADVLRARERLAAAQDKLQLAKQAAERGPASGYTIDQIKEIRNNALNEVANAREELRLANEAFREGTRAAPAVISETAEALPSRTVPGASGAQNWARAMATQELPEATLEQVQTMRKTGEGGAQRLIDEDLARLQKIKELGESEQRLVGQGRGQLMLPPEEAARVEAELAERQAAQAAEQARIQQIAERERIAREAELRARQQSARARLRDVGQTAARTGEQAKEAIKLAEGAKKAESGLTLAQQAAKRAEEARLGPAQRLGAYIGSSKVLSPLLGGLAGVGTLMSVDEAIQRARAGDYSGAVIPTLEAAFGLMSMMPAWNPITAGIKGIGTAGGLGLGAYQLGKYGLQKAKE
jgi:hypothetical protein